MIGQDKSLQQKLFKALHQSTIGGHSRIKATYQRMKKLFYWTGMKKEIELLVSQCPICQRSKHENCKYPGLLDPLPTPDMAWAHVSLDFIEGLPKSQGKEVILVVVDKLTKYAHFIPLTHPYTVNSVIEAFMDNVVKLHGPPTVLISDRDRIFTSTLWKAIFKGFRVDLRFSSAYHPQSDGQTERVNQCLENYLRCMIFQEPHKWSKWLSLAEFWYNTSYHTALNITPFQALYGNAPPQISELSVPGPSDLEATEFLTAKTQMLQQLKENLAQATARMKKFADRNRSERTLAVGDMVYLKMQPYRMAAFGLRGAIKLHSKFYGPFRVIQTVGNRAYKLLLPEGVKIHPVFHVSQLKKHVGPTVVPSSDLPLVDANGKIHTAPALVLQVRQIPRNNLPVVQWLIQWEGLSPEEASWEDADFIKIFSAFFRETVEDWMHPDPVP